MVVLEIKVPPNLVRHPDKQDSKREPNLEKYPYTREEICLGIEALVGIAKAEVTSQIEMIGIGAWGLELWGFGATHAPPT